MSGPAVLFRKIHRLQLRLQDLQENLARLPRQRKGQENKVAYQENLLQELKNELEKARKDNADREKGLENLHKQIVKYERQRNQATSRKEMDALTAEIGHDTTRIGELEEAILLGIEEIEQRAPAIPQQEEVVKQVKKERAEFEASLAEREASLKEMVTQVEQELEAALAEMPEVIKPVYERLQTGTGADEAFSPAAGGTCKACGIRITPQNETDLMMENLVVCISCGRLLYLAED